MVITAADPALMGVGGSNIPAAVTAALTKSRDTRSEEQRNVLQTFYRERVAGPIRQAELAHEAAKKSLADFHDKVPTAMVMKEGSPQDAFVLIRGEYDKRGEKVQPGLPAFLPPLPEGAPADRLSMARWIVSRDNPLTARVWVNRIW